MSKVPEVIDSLLRTLPPSSLILITCDPYTYPFHVGIELARRYFINFKWYIIVNDLIQRYLSIIRYGFNVVKDDVELIHGLCEGIESFTKALTTDNSLIYVIVNAFKLNCMSEYVKTLVNRPPQVKSVTFIQVDETLSRPFTYLADLIIRLRLLEDVDSLRTSARIAKFITTRTYSEVVVNYSILPGGVIFEEVSRV